jgi:hypothetical protein
VETESEPLSELSPIPVALLITDNSMASLSVAQASVVSIDATVTPVRLVNNTSYSSTQPPPLPTKPPSASVHTDNKAVSSSTSTQQQKLPPPIPTKAPGMMSTHNPVENSKPFQIQSKPPVTDVATSSSWMSDQPQVLEPLDQSPRGGISGRGVRKLSTEALNIPIIGFGRPLNPSTSPRALTSLSNESMSSSRSVQESIDTERSYDALKETTGSRAVIGKGKRRKPSSRSASTDSDICVSLVDVIGEEVTAKMIALVEQDDDI